VPSELEIATARVIAWKRSKPTLLLDPGQRQWVDKFKTSEGATVWCIGRQRGKTYAAMAYACEFAMQNPGSIIRYAAKTKESARGIVLPTLSQLFEWCPEGLRPELDESSATWKNGSVLTWAGTDAQSFDRLRGPRAHLIILDESGFYQDLERVEAALLPQLTTTQGRVLYLSTPPESLAHPFAQRYYAALASGSAERETLHDNPRLTAEQKYAILRQYADARGMDIDSAERSTFWRREYLAEFVTEESKAAVPGYTVEHSEKILKEWTRPQYRDHYTSLDIGYRDGHGVLFAYWDFKTAKLIIEDELVLRGKTTDELCTQIKLKETALYGVEKFDGTLIGAKDWEGVPDYIEAYLKSISQQQPYLRVADDNALILADIIQRHGIAFLPTRKDDKAAAVDDLDIAIRREQVVIHPRCKNLHRQLLATTWDNNRREWERTSDGHGELVDCAVYLWRNIRRHKNPEPVRPQTTFDRYLADLHKTSSEKQWNKLNRVRKYG